MGKARLSLTPEFLADLIDMDELNKSLLIPDAKGLELQWNYERQCFEFIVERAEFDKALEDADIPDVYLAYRWTEGEGCSLDFWRYV